MITIILLVVLGLLGALSVYLLLYNYIMYGSSGIPITTSTVGEDWKRRMYADRRFELDTSDPVIRHIYILSDQIENNQITSEQATKSLGDFTKEK